VSADAFVTTLGEISAAEIIVTASVRERQRSTAALAPASWVLRSSSRDGVDDESRDRTTDEALVRRWPPA